MSVGQLRADLLGERDEGRGKSGGIALDLEWADPGRGDRRAHGAGDLGVDAADIPANGARGHILGVRIIGVIDLMNSRAVAARGGVRSEYQPLRSALLGADQVGDAAALARATNPKRMWRKYMSPTWMRLQGGRCRI